MFCEKCGKENPADVKFCEGCGAPFATQAEEVPVEETPANEVPATEENNTVKKSDISKILKIAAAVVVAILAIVLIANLFGGSVYENTVEDYLNARADGNASKLQKLMVDPCYYEYLTSKDGGDYKDEEVKWVYDEKAEDAMDSIRESYGTGVKYSVKTIYLTKYTSKQVGDIADWLEDEYDYEKKDVKDVVVLEYKGTVKGSEGSNVYEGERALIKVKGKWYISEIISDKDDIRNILN